MWQITKRGRNYTGNLPEPTQMPTQVPTQVPTQATTQEPPKTSPQESLGVVLRAQRESTEDITLGPQRGSTEREHSGKGQR